jgi:hypothetical protein
MRHTKTGPGRLVRFRAGQPTRDGLSTASFETVIIKTPRRRESNVHGLP